MGVDGRVATAPRERLLVSFAGTELAPGAAESIARRASGVTLYRHLNVRSAAQVRALTDSLQAGARRLRLPALLVGADHETGQLHALADDATPFAGAMALGAVGDEALAERVGAAIGRELRALGVTVVFAPDCDLATNPRNLVVGIRSFGDDPQAVGRLAAAQVRGLQSAGVAATVKHLPGHGDPSGDSHLGLPVIESSAAAIRARELVPFRTAIEAGPWLAMAGHLGVPALTGRRDLPATLAREVVTDLLRDELGFRGLAVSDALDMGGVQGAGDGPDVLAALAAGTDLLLCGPDPASQARVEAALAGAVGRLDPAEAVASRDRLGALVAWLAAFEAPSLEAVGSADHRALADELARRSITRIRDRAGQLGRRVRPDASILVVEPAPVDLTPADTTSLLAPGGLAAAMRSAGRHRVEGLVVGDPIEPAELAAIRARADRADLVVLGTVNALGRPTLVELGRALAASGRPVIAVALRGPWDGDALPELGTMIATYGIQPPSLAAAAAAILEGAPISGRPPVRLSVAS